MTTMYYDKDANLDLIKSRKIAIIGYGSQGHAHALNLRDSGCDVRVGLYPGSRSWAEVERAGLSVMTVQDAAKEADVIMIVVPDQVGKKVYDEGVAPGLAPGNTLMFAHGFNIHFSQVVPPDFIDVSMIAPKAPGHMMRRVYTEGSGVPALLAVHQNYSGQAKEVALAYAAGLGSTRAGVLETTFREETETDLFGEQTVLCGGISALIKTAFETLVEAGYQPEVAYFECLHEMKLIVDLMYQGGLSFMRYSISETAEFGDYSRGTRVIDDHVRQSMKQILTEIQDGTFAREWILENQAGRPAFNAMRKRENDHQIEVVGERLRDMMSWLNARKREPATVPQARASS